VTFKPLACVLLASSITLLPNISAADWKLEASRDRFTDKASTYVTADEISGGARLFISCNRIVYLDSKPMPVFKFQVSTRKFLGESALTGRSVRYRLGGNGPHNTWWVYNDTSAESHPKEEKDVEDAFMMVSALVDGMTLRLELSTYRYEAVQLEFSPTGLNAIFEPFLNDCFARTKAAGQLR
jgi:hypothetical protein